MNKAQRKYADALFATYSMNGMMDWNGFMTAMTRVELEDFANMKVEPTPRPASALDMIFGHGNVSPAASNTEEK